MVVLAVLCVGSVSAMDYDNLTSDSQEILVTTDSIDVSQEEIETDENDVLEASDDDEVLSDYNQAEWHDGVAYYYDDSISGSVTYSGSSLSVGDTIHITLGSEKTNYDYGDARAFLRIDGDPNYDNWIDLGTYKEAYTNGIDYVIQSGGSHYFQPLAAMYGTVGNGASCYFAKGVYIENIAGDVNRKYGADYSLTVTQNSIDLGNSVDITFSYENLGDPSLWWSTVSVTNEPVWFYVNGEKVGEKTISGSDSGSVTFTYTPTSAGTLTVEAFVPQNYKDTQNLPRGWAGPVTVTVVGSGGNPSQTVLKLYIDSNKELVYGEAGTVYKLYNTLTDENGNSVYTYLAQSSDGSVTENITIYTNGDTTGQIPAGAEPQFTSGVNYGFDSYGIWTVNASYAGNSNGLSSADSNDVVIIYWDKTTTTHSLDSTSVDKGSTIKITPKVIADTSNLEVENDGQVSIYVDNNLITTIDAGKSYDLDTSTLTVDSHNIYCVYTGYSEDYKGTSYELLKTSQSSQSSFTVKSVDVSTKTSIDVSPKEVNIGDKVTITPTVTFEGKNLGVGDGKVAIYINGVKKGETDPGVGFDYTTESSGTFTVKAEYLGKDNYLKSNSSDDSFKVNKLNATLSVNPNNTNIELGSKITLTSTLTPEDATGTISYTSDDGQTGTGLSFDYTPTSEGTHTVTVYYGGNDKYNNITEYIIVNAFKSSSSINIDELITRVYGQSFTVNTTTVNSNGNIGVRLVNKKGNIEITGVTSHENIVNIPIIDVGEYDLYVSTNPGPNHESETAHSTVIIIPKNSTISVESASGDWGSVIPVTVSLGEGSGGISTAKIYDASGNTFIKYATLNGNSVSVSGLAAGEYVIKINNTAESNYNSIYANATVTVNPVASDVEFSDIVFVYGGSNSSSVSLVGAGDYVAVVVGQNANILKESGKITVSGLDVGSYDLNITTVGDENHTSVSKTHKVIVLAKNSSISSKDIEVKYDGKTILVEYTSTDALNISYAVYDNDMIVDSGNVKADDNINVKSLPVGEYTINLKTIVDNNHISVNETYMIAVISPELEFSVTAIDATYPDNGKIEVKSNVDGEYLVEVNNKTYTVNVKDGVGSTSVDQLPPNTYPVAVTSNIPNYDNVTKNVNLVVKAKAKDIITLVEHYDVVKDYLIGDDYQVRVLLNGKSIGAGKVVTIITHGVTYKCKTDKNGYAILPINLVPGKYVITAEYAGIKVSNKILVKPTLKAKSVTKKKAKKIKFKATLKTSKGKPISGKKISFKIRGKFYTAKTNKKGIATVSFKNLKVGKYSILIKYVKQKVKVKLKVKN